MGAFTVYISADIDKAYIDTVKIDTNRVDRYISTCEYNRQMGRFSYSRLIRR